jgi:hypothetical protein
MKIVKLLAGVVAICILPFLSLINANFGNALAQFSTSSIYLPFIEKDAQYGFGTESKFIGIYMQQYWTDENVLTYLPPADDLAAKKHSVVGWFIDIQDSHFVYGHPHLPTNNLYRQLEALWSKGYVSFLNINSTTSAYAIASGELDAYLGRMAEYYAAWINLGGGRRAFLAPLPEMNGVMMDGQPWAPYGGNPINFKLAYQRIQDIFAQKGVSRDQAWWVFAPNGWSMPEHDFEIYYPGDSAVDAVGFSMYNFGWCYVAGPNYKWENYDTLYEPYISRIYAMAPDKPIIIAQTGTTAQYYGQFNVDAKNTWLVANYEYLSSQPQLLGILYFDLDLSPGECNWRVVEGNTFEAGYRGGVSFPAFQYLDGQALQGLIP